MNLYINPKKVLRNLDIRYIKTNKLVNIFLILAIISTCILYTNIFTILFTMNSSMREQIFIEVGTRDSGSFDYLNKEEIKQLSNDSRIISSSYVVSVGTVKNPELNKKFITNMFYFSPEHYENYQKNNLEILEGSYPVNENEVITSLTVLKELNVKPEIGETFKINYVYQNSKIEKEFVLSGYYDLKYKNDQQLLLVSEQFLKQTIYDGTDNYFLYVNFKNNNSLGEKFYDIVQDYNLDKDETRAISFTINPAYSKYSFVDIEMIIAIFGVALVIIISGYLMIYNIFNISIINNIKFYGLLKNIGFTSKQIKFFVFKQGMYLTLCSLPLGLIFGYMLSYKILPAFGGMLNVDLKIQYNPYIFILSVLFVLLTVYISLRVPAKYADQVSAAEALKTSGVGNIRKSAHKMKKVRRISVFSLAMINILRNKKQFVIIIVSLSLMPVIFNSIYTFVNSFNYQSYVNNFMSTDFVAAHYKYFMYEYDEHSTVDEEFINYINENELKESGVIYYENALGRSYTEDGFERVSEKIFTTFYNGIDYDIQMYGLDKFPLSKYEVVNGKLDEKLLDTGNYILEIIEVDDFGEPDYSSMRFAVGDNLEIKFNNNTVKTYTVLAQVKQIKSFSDLRGTLDFFADLALPSEEYLKITQNPRKMSYVFNVGEENLTDMEEKLTKYIEVKDNNMQFQSVLSYKEKFEEVKLSFLLPGAFISGLIGFIGIMNFINMLITSIVSRKKELYILYQIGMTEQQMGKMLFLEGILYTIFSGVLFLIAGGIFNITVLKFIVNNIWFAKYQFSMLILLVTLPVYAICSTLIISIAGNFILKNNKV